MSEEKDLFVDYKKEHKKPYSVDYFGLGEHWNNEDGSWEDEVSIIEDYYKAKIKRREAPDSISFIKKDIEKIEKLHNIQYQTNTVKCGVVAEYLKFLSKTDGIRKSYRNF